MEIILKEKTNQALSNILARKQELNALMNAELEKESLLLDAIFEQNDIDTNGIESIKLENSVLKIFYSKDKAEK